MRHEVGDGRATGVERHIDRIRRGYRRIVVSEARDPHAVVAVGAGDEAPEQRGLSGAGHTRDHAHAHAAGLLKPVGELYERARASGEQPTVARYVGVYAARAWTPMYPRVWIEIER